MGHFFTDNLMLQEYANAKFQNYDTQVKLWPTSCVEPNDYMETYLFDIVNFGANRFQFSESELQTANPDWFNTHWSFVKQMAEAGKTVWVYSDQWYEYGQYGSKFVVSGRTPLLHEDGIIMVGDNDKLSYSSARIIDIMFKRLVADKEHLKNIEKYQSDYEELCEKLFVEMSTF